nr:MAG TPA: hypothetical protein [Caudoviricetes sp.]
MIVIASPFINSNILAICYLQVNSKLHILFI